MQLGTMEEREPPQNDSAPASGYLSWFGSDEARTYYIP